MKKPAEKSKGLSFETEEAQNRWLAEILEEAEDAFARQNQPNSTQEAPSPVPPAKAQFSRETNVLLKQYEGFFKSKNPR